MNLSIAAMAALTLISALWLSRPWWRRDRGAGLRRRSVNVAAYRQRLVEIDAEQAAGLATADAADALRREAGARLLEDAAAAEPASSSPTPMRAVAALLLGALLAVFAGGYYYLQGSWRSDAMVTAERAAVPGSSAAVEELVTGLAQRLQANPQDVQGWAMLARSYFVMQRYAEAASAYARLNALSDNRDLDALTGEGEALALAANRDLTGRPRQLFEHALTLQPDHAKSLWYAGMAAFQAGDNQTAKTRWTALRQQTLPDELREVLDQRLAEMGADPPSLAASAPSPDAASTVPSAASLKVQLSLAPSLVARIPAGATLLVFARAETGPPMPLAVYRAPVAGFPLQITLDDSMAMMPTLKLSNFDRWTVTARISRSGQAKAESGDLQGSQNLARADAQKGLALVIDSVVP